MPIHNAAFSAASLAKTLLQGLDRSKPETTLPTQTVELLLNTILDLIMPAPALRDGAQKAVDGMAARFNGSGRG